MFVRWRVLLIILQLKHTGRQSRSTLALTATPLGCLLPCGSALPLGFGVASLGLDKATFASQRRLCHDDRVCLDQRGQLEARKQQGWCVVSMLVCVVQTVVVLLIAVWILILNAMDFVCYFANCMHARASQGL